MNEIDWKRVQSYFGFTDAEMERIKASPKIVKVMKAAGQVVRTRLVCEVIFSRGCAHGLKSGQRYVISSHGQIIIKECTAPLCVYMIAPLVMALRVVHDRICEGVDPNGLVWDHVRCLDTGLECGGLGEVAMKVRVEEKPQAKA